MFYKLILQKLIIVAPEHLGCSLNRELKELLRKAVEGTKLPPGDTVSAIATDLKSLHKSSAIILAVLDILNAQFIQGRVLDSGSVSFLLTYEALVLKLHRGEVLDVKVVSVGADGWQGSVFGVSHVFVSRASMSESIQRPDWEYHDDGYWVNQKEGKFIRKDDMVRIRIIAETSQKADTMAIGSMMEKYLGPLDVSGNEEAS